MTFEVDDEILQDFLVEAGEILELLSEQLVELENNPNDTQLLNAIFRGFHTVKGGAGFLSLTELINTCHGAENVFDGLRQGLRPLDSELMDTILATLDIINEQFSAVQNGEQMVAAPPHILDKLHKLSKAEEVAIVAPVAVVVDEPAESIDASSNDVDPFEFDSLFDEISVQSNAASPTDTVDSHEDEFESLLDELHGVGKSASQDSSGQKDLDKASSDEIDEDEFENLLDSLHGKGSHSTQKKTTSIGSDEIDEDEFESLLDELHGKNSHGSNINKQEPVIDEIEQEFESLLDELQGKGAQSTNAKESSTADLTDHELKSILDDIQKTDKAPQSTPPPSAIQKPEVAKAPSPSPVKKAVEAPTKTPDAKVTQIEQSVRVDTKTLDEIMNMVGELVLVRNRLVSLETSSENEEISRAIANLAVVTSDIQGSVMKTRMQPIKKVFGKFPRVVRDLARQLGKNINLELLGEETDLDKNLVEALADPLVHLVRNSVDHGIEMPDVRLQTGKSEQGKITLSAAQEGDHILLVIQDDGAGMDADKLKSIAIKKGVLDQETADRMSNKEAYSLIFAPGFSTKVEVSDISGRGVGMDVVKTSIGNLNGTISIDSEMGVGTRLEITVPLTLAILPTLMVKVATQTFALPLTNVNEIFHLNLAKTNKVNGQLTVVIRDQAIPLFYLRDWLAPKAKPVEKSKGLGHVVIVQLGIQQIAFVVDALLGQEEVVIKALGKLLTGTPGMAGATITSDGGIALILDLPSLLKHYL
jgi:two-component system, chemotaxis family, sensor kinase CheA